MIFWTGFLTGAGFILVCGLLLLFAAAKEFDDDD